MVPPPSVDDPAAPRRGHRQRVPLPGVLRQLSPGLRPSLLFHTPGTTSVELHYPGDIHLSVDVPARRVEARRPGQAAPEAIRRLLAGVQRRWLDRPELADWLDRLVERHAHAGVGDDHATVTPAGRLLAVLELGTSGRGAAVAEQLEDLSRSGLLLDPRHQLAAGSMLAAIERPAAALEPLSRAVALLGRGAAELRAAAVEAGEADELRRAVEALSEEQREPWALLRDLVAVDDFEGAKARARARLEDAPSQDARLDAAELELWASAVEDAEALLEDADGSSSRAQRIAGACRVLRGHWATALPLLESAEAQGDAQAPLWRAEALVRLGRIDEAREALRHIRSGEQPASRLLEGIIALEHGGLVDDARQVFPYLLTSFGLGRMASASVDELREAGWVALTRLGGNRGVPVTLMDGEGQLRAHRDPPPRVEAERMQRTLLHSSPEAVLRAFERHREGAPELPFSSTYPAELLLWLGRYDEARELLEAAWARFETRWAYVGAGAAAALAGRHDAAIEWWSRGEAHFGLLDAEATWAYRGEAWRRAGALDRAVADLEHALRYRPSRHGTRVDLARAHLERGDEAAARRELQHLGHHAPPLLAEARGDGGPASLEDLPASTCAEVLATATQMLRGNRSSKLLTFVDREGELRVFADRHQERWAVLSRRLEFLADDARVEARLQG